MIASERDYKHFGEPEKKITCWGYSAEYKKQHEKTKSSKAENRFDFFFYGQTIKKFQPSLGFGVHIANIHKFCEKSSFIRGFYG